MERGGKKVRGTCIGLVVANKGTSIQGGLYSALEDGRGKICSLDSNDPEIMEFVTALVNTFIEVDRQWGKNS